MRWLGWSFLYIACGCLGAAVLQSLYFQSFTLLSLNEFISAFSGEPMSLAAVGHLPTAAPPLALGLGLLVRGNRKHPRLFGPKRRTSWF